MTIKLKKKGKKTPTSIESSMADFHGCRLWTSSSDNFFMSQ